MIKQLIYLCIVMTLTAVGVRRWEFNCPDR